MVSVVSLGATIDRRQTALWRKIEQDIFQDHRNYAPTVPSINTTDDTEFFVAYDGDKAIGRAAASVNQAWVKEKGRNLGFVNDFIVAPGYESVGEELIQRCLAVLRDKGVEGVLARSNGFPALSAHKFVDDVPPCMMACNPPWYIDVFERCGFVKETGWVNFRIGLPRRILQEDIQRGKRSAEVLGMRVRKIRWLQRSHIDEFHDLQDLILEDHIGYTPSRSVYRDSTTASHWLFVVMSKLGRMKIAVVENASGQLVGCLSFSPNFNVPLRRLWYKKSWRTLVALPGFVVAFARARRAQIGVVGLASGERGKGLVWLIDAGIDAMVKSGYREMDTGPIRAENRVVVKMVSHLQKKYDLPCERMDYYGLLHTFDA